MLEERYALERMRLSGLKLQKEADLAHPVFGEGNADRPLIMFIGEAPGREEAACSRPFVGKAGKQLDAMLETAGIERSRVFVTNAVKYRPYRTKNGHISNRTPSPEEVRDGLELLRQEIEIVHPALIATLGNVPLQAVTMLSWDRNHLVTTVGEAHGKPMTLMVDKVPRKLFPLYHPAATIYNRDLRPVLESDLIRLGEYARKTENEW